MNPNLKKLIQKLKITSLYLFFLTNISICGTLFFHNYLTSSEYTYHFKTIPKYMFSEINCSKDNNYCYEPFWKVDSVELDDCSKIGPAWKYKIDGKLIATNSLQFQNIVFNQNKKIKENFLNKKITVSIEMAKESNAQCIKNYPITYSIYKYIPQIPTKIVKIKSDQKYFDATGKIVNPFLYGETSISNIAKRYPLYFIFKPFLFITSFLMILYWIYTQRIICRVTNNTKIEPYFILGILSGIFLFLHVFFLGSEFENELLKKLRRSIIAFFIFCELGAQFYLIKKLLEIKVLILKLINHSILKIKRFFVIFFLLFTSILLLIMTIYNLPKEVDYIVEWNYFVILSFYYLFTFYLWNKLSSNPTTA